MTKQGSEIANFHRWFLSLVAAAFVFFGVHLAAASSLNSFGFDRGQNLLNLEDITPADFERLYPRGLHFRIKRNGEEIGFHKAQMTRSDDVIAIENHTVMNTRVFLGLFPYQLEYRAKSRWRGEDLIDFVADIEEQGNQREIVAEDTGDGFQLKIDDQVQPLAEKIMPSPHWLSLYINGSGLLHGLTGDIWDIAYDHNDTILLNMPDGNVEARKYAVKNAEITASEWYDNRGRWLAMEFEAPDGSSVTYECIECGLPQQVSLAQY